MDNFYNTNESRVTYIMTANIIKVSQSSVFELYHANGKFTQQAYFGDAH